MAPKQNSLKKWMKRERITQKALAVMTGIKQSVISGHANGLKVSDEALGNYIRNKPITGMTQNLIESIRDQHLK